jgi:arylsulfatase A-like enzyme
MNVITILCDTLRRDHCGPYHRGQPVSALGDVNQPDWVVPTPNIDRLAARGTTFDNAWCGSHPCMPARRDLYTGRFEFPFRGWGPLEDTDRDLPREVSGAVNASLARPGIHVSQLVTDHFHLWEQGSGNYHMGYSGFEFIRGIESDNWLTDPIDVRYPSERYRLGKNERHYRNLAILRRGQNEPAADTYFAHRTFSTAADWLDRNHTWDDFYLHIDSFPPHEPWDPPERLVKLFDERGYDVPEYFPTAAYDLIEKSGYTEDQVRHVQALYAASVVYVDECLGMLLDMLDRHSLWDDTVVILTTDHGTYNGSRRRTGKGQTHLFAPISHIPLIVAHPTAGHGERRDQLVQLVDLYPTTLAALGLPIPEDRHGIDLAPVLADPTATTRDHAVCGRFGGSVSITDGRWMLHHTAVERNEPLYWYSHHLSRFFPIELGPFECLPDDRGRRPVIDLHSWPLDESWLSDLENDPHETRNHAEDRPEELRRLQVALRDMLYEIGAPDEQHDRLGLRGLDA